MHCNHYLVLKDVYIYIYILLFLGCIASYVVFFVTFFVFVLLLVLPPIAFIVMSDKSMILVLNRIGVGCYLSFFVSLSLSFASACYLQYTTHKGKSVVKPDPKW